MNIVPAGVSVIYGEHGMDSEAVLYPATFSISKKPTAKQRLREARPLILFFGGCFLFGFLIPPISAIFGSPLWFASGSNWFFFLISMFVVGAASGLAAVFAVRTVSRRLLGRNLKTIQALEDRLTTGASADVMGDLDALITANVRAKRGPVAEYYSKQLLRIAEHDHQGEPVIPDVMLSTPAWVSTPEYHKSINYWLVWLFQSRGLLCLTSEHLEYESTRLSFRVDLKDIVDISLDRHPLWIKPYPLKYIKISFKDSDYDHIYCMHVSPYTMQTDTVLDINKSVQDWYMKLTRALQKVEQ